MQDRFDVVVIGAGAAGIAALRRLGETGVSAVGLEAQPRIGGRAHTVLAGPGLPVDRGCGWLHSADVNPLAGPIEAAGFTVDRSPPHWTRQAGAQNFPEAEQAAFGAAFDAFEARLAAAARSGPDRPAADLLAPGERWNPLIDAVSSYYNGAEFDQVSVLDYDAYEDSEVNWRVAEGYGTAIAAFAQGPPIVTDCPAITIRHDGAEIRVETARGALTCRGVIVTVSSALIAAGRPAFVPDLPRVREAAAGLPLGLADKVFLGLEGADEFPVEGHLFGRIDRTETGSYHLRPLGRPYVEAFLGGRCARHLEAEGAGAMTAFAIEELAGLLGSGIRRRLTPLGETAWAAEPFALGAYSHALPGRATARAVLAEPVDGRLFFAGEATSPHAYSTAHGAWRTGVAAADAALAVLG